MDNMVLTIIQQYTIIPVFLICLCLGYAIKHVSFLEPIANQFIPLIACIVGAVLACWMNTAITVEIVAQGMVSGLASTGFHQLVGQLLERYASKMASDTSIWEDKEEGEDDGE